MSENHFHKIALVGAGNVAIHLGLALKHADFNVDSVINRSRDRGGVLAKKLDAHYLADLASLNNPDLVIVAVSDDAISMVAAQLAGRSFPVVHTSGTVSKDVLSLTGSDYGVFYPFQTFSVSNAVDFSKVPICIDASNPAFTNRIEQLAHVLSHTVCRIDDQKRRILHLAGVFASNFSNYLYAIAEDLLANNDIPFELLLPLIQETAGKIRTIPPLEAQTGPAKRGDISTIQKHLQLLENEPDLLELYKTFTDNILKTYSHQTSTSEIQLNEDK